jgi:CheY-like chemotaxis protein
MGDIPVVLVVEDEWLLRDCLAAHLRAARWHVLQARSGEAAIALLHAGKHVDVVVTDIELGGSINGWSVGKRFRTILPQIAVIYTSGNAWPSVEAVSKSLFISNTVLPARATLCHDRPAMSSPSARRDQRRSLIRCSLLQ